MTIAALPDDSNDMQSQSTNSLANNSLSTNKIAPTPSSSNDHPLRQFPPPATLASLQIFTHSRSCSPPAVSNSSASSSFTIVKDTVMCTHYLMAPLRCCFEEAVLLVLLVMQMMWCYWLE